MIDVGATSVSSSTQIFRIKTKLCLFKKKTVLARAEGSVVNCGNRIEKFQHF